MPDRKILTFPPSVQRIVDSVVFMLMLLQVGLWAGRALRFYLEIKEMERGPDRVFAGSLDIINFVARMLIWSLLILVALENLGVNITALLAGLGVGGVAVALALQNVLGDLFASLSIALDKPFVVGDMLTIDDFHGRGGTHRHQDHAAAQRHRRADHPVERRYLEEPRAQFRPRARAARARDHSGDLRDARREARRQYPSSSRASCASRRMHASSAAT